jgi:hypothetical protein
MRLLAILLAVIQFTFAFHAVRTGRGAKWVMIIVLARAERETASA